MEDAKQSTQTTKMVQMSSTFKMTIPAEVEKKIRFICQKVWNVEWSGTLFFTHKGSFEDGSLEIICKDIFVMDIGTQGYTEFDMSPDVITYMTENPELLDCQMGLIHSHNNMSTFFSGTDQATLKEEGMDRNNFVSLIVNNAGSYTAAITRKVKSTKAIHDCYSYEFFGEGAVEHCKDYSTETEELEWYYLKIEKQGEVSNFQELEDRLEEIKKAKDEAKRYKPITAPSTYKGISYGSYPIGDYGTPLPKKKEEKAVQGSLFDDEETMAYNNSFYEGDGEIPFGKVHFDKQVIKALVAQIISGCIVINDNKFDYGKWANNMQAIYEKRFKGNMKVFSEWANSYLDFLVCYAEDKKLEKVYDDSEIIAILSYDLIIELEKLPKNKYLDSYIKELEKYLVV